MFLLFHNHIFYKCQSFTVPLVQRTKFLNNLSSKKPVENKDLQGKDMLFKLSGLKQPNRCLSPLPEVIYFWIWEEQSHTQKSILRYL